MGGLSARIDGRDVTYFPDGPYPRMRRFSVRLLPSWPVMDYYLHWSDGTDLEALDARVAAGTATDDDFRGALVADLRNIQCLHCGASLDVAAIDTGHVMFAHDRAERLAAHRFEESCPCCKTPQRIYIVEILDSRCPDDPA